MAVLPIPAWNIEGNPNFHSIGDPPSSSSSSASTENQNPVSVSMLLDFALSSAAV
ncbi:hypothetical protein RP20_CCG007274 [Aedes albopictus]|nr:hypothetical protein RP20_CCG007274 [Aedes albopictus]